MEPDLQKLVKDRNAIGALLLRRDGLVANMYLSGGNHLETISIMLATAFGAAYTSMMHLKGESPRKVLIESDTMRVEMTPVESSKILVMIYPRE